MRLEFFERRFSFADADRQLMAASSMINDASCDYENSRLVSDDCGEWVNFEEVVGVLSPEQSISELTCGYVFHVIHCITVATSCNLIFVSTAFDL